ncbi:alpha/beta hydrolase [Spirosoma areae]
MNPPIVFIHGMFMNPKSWDNWRQYFEKSGYETHAPAWPYHEGDPAQLQRQIHPLLGKLTLDEVISAMETYLAKLPQKPVLVGHSMGGLIVQVLVAKGLAQAGICIDSAAPNGMLSFEWSFLKSNLPVLNPLAGDKPFVMDERHFHYAFCNTLTPDQARQALADFAVPESRNVARSSTGKAGKIDVSKPHAPLLFIAGENDHIVPASLNEKNYRAYTDKTSRTDFKLFANRDHFICGEPGWQEVAGYVANWIPESAA